MAFDPKSVKLRTPRRTAGTVVMEHGYWCRCKGAGENIQWILHKNEHNLAEAMHRNENSIVGEVGETLTQLITRLGWI